MNRLMQQKGVLLETLKLREELLGATTDADLAFALPGNPTLAGLFLEFAAVEAAYTRSFREFVLRFQPAPPGPTTVAGLKARFAELDAELFAVLEALSDDDLSRPVDRGGWSLSAEVNYHVFREAVLIFAAKASVYLRAMNKPLPPQVAVWIG